jgi:hypothetical protein
MCYTINGQEYTFLAKDELERALPVLKKAYLTYDEVAGKTVQYMFFDLFKDYIELKAETLSSSCFINDGKGNFEKAPEGMLPDLRDSGSVVAAADFDGNGVPDLVWMNTQTRQATVHYFAAGGVFTGWNYLNAGGIPGWSVVAAADINHDGVPDLIWQSDTTRQVTVHYFGGAGGATFQGWNWLTSTGFPGWHVAAVADFDGNGTPDLVWQSDVSRQVTVHYYGGAGGATFLGWNWLQADGLPGWTVAGANDFDGNGVADLVWQNDTTRQVSVYYYGGAQGATPPRSSPAPRRAAQQRR